jgi:2,3-bisphosphoglycerate-independent phosphoglycerate mutase
MAKIIFFIIDGLGGLPTSLLKNKTALEAAKTPSLDYFAEKGRTGFTKNFKKDDEWFIRANGSNFGYISLFGVNPRKTSWKRGPIEAAGVQADFKEGDLALRFDFAYVNPKGVVESRRAGRISNEEGRAFVEEIKEKIRYSGDFEIKHYLRHRGVIVLKSSQKLGGDIVCSDPLKNGLKPRGIEAFKKTEANMRSANMLNIFEQKVNEVLDITKLNVGRRSRGGYPVNRILTRGAGTQLPDLPIYNDFAAICASGVEFGMARISKMKVLGLENPTEEYVDDVNHTLELLKKNFAEHDKFMVFIKAPDTYGHDGNSNKKKQSIEHIDKTIFSFLKEKLNLKEDILCVTADHATPAKLMRHTAEPIPLLISGKLKPDMTTKFGERYCKNGELGEKWGYEIMTFIYKLYRS